MDVDQKYIFMNEILNQRMFKRHMRKLEESPCKRKYDPFMHACMLAHTCTCANTSECPYCIDFIEYHNVPAFPMPQYSFLEN